MRDPKFLALVGLREDGGLAAPCVANLRRIGFNHIALFCTEEFADETDALARHLGKANDLSFISVPSLNQIEEKMALDGPLMGPILERISADWILSLDVDEFPVARGNDISRIPGLDTADSIACQRYNHARQRGESEAHILSLLEEPGRIPLISSRQDQVPSLKRGECPRWVLHTIGPKVMVRPEVFERFTIGTHAAKGWRGNGPAPREMTSSDIVLAHIPFTSQEKFKAKVANAQAHFGRTSHHTGQLSWHWKWWVQRMEEGGLAEEYDREALSEAEYTAMRERGAIRTAEEMLEARKAN